MDGQPKWSAVQRYKCVASRNGQKRSARGTSEASKPAKMLVLKGGRVMEAEVLARKSKRVASRNGQNAVQGEQVRHPSQPKCWLQKEIQMDGQPKWPKRRAKGTSEAPKPAKVLALERDPNGWPAEVLAREAIQTCGQPKWPERSARGTSEASKPAKVLALERDPNGWPAKVLACEVIQTCGQPKWPERSARGTSEASKPAKVLAPERDPNGWPAEMAKTQGKGDE